MNTLQARWLPACVQILPVCVAMALLACSSASGAVQRRLTICSDPPGAVVYVDNFALGTTPVSTNFVYYGTRQIRLVKDGYETLTILQPIPAPWYELPVLDFFSENLTPGELRDHRTFSYRLIPQAVVPSEVLRQRAEDLRGRAAASGAVLTMPNTPPPAASTTPAATVVPGPATVIPAPQSLPGAAPTMPGIVPNVPGAVPNPEPVPAPPGLPATLPQPSTPSAIPTPGGWTVPQQ